MKAQNKRGDLRQTGAGRRGFNVVWGRMNDVRDDIYKAMLALKEKNGSFVTIIVSVELLTEEGSKVMRMAPVDKWNNIRVQYVTNVLDEETFTLKPVKTEEEFEEIKRINLYTWLQYVQPYISSVLKAAEEGQATVTADVVMTNGKHFTIIRNEDSLITINDGKMLEGSVY